MLTYTAEAIPPNISDPAEADQAYREIFSEKG